ncbi:MAG TPA: zf-HC2 domain-containing protein [Usitatibacter sp.]|jgi:anti-sigma factor RsiW|nr:zf-HC2 domain-containing protein [Usitatibacter sp.]
MNCNEAAKRFAAYVDGELPGGQCARLDAHLSECARCRGERSAQAFVHLEMRKGATRFAVSPILRRRIESAIAAQAAAQPRRARVRAPSAFASWWERMRESSLLAPAAGLAFAALATSNVVLLASRPTGEDLLAQEVVASHVRAMVAASPFDVESSDRHTVKPWYAGKLEFSPPVTDFAAEGFALRGGRLDYLDGARVAALVYQRDKHVIDVFIAPAASSARPQALSRRGYNLLHWSSGGMSYWAASDVEATELSKLQKLITPQQAM